MENEEYIKRLEGIIDKQDKLLSQFDAKFNQQKALCDQVAKRNSYLSQDLEKYKNLLKDMKKSLTQHKNTITKLKKELEEQLKIQQKLHKDYGEIIKELTDELEGEEGEKSKTEPSKEEPKAKEETSSKSDRPTLPPREDKVDHVSEATNIISNIAEKSQKTIKEATTPKGDSKTKKCPNCGKDVDSTYSFCDNCGHKLI